MGTEDGRDLGSSVMIDVTVTVSSITVAGCSSPGGVELDSSSSLSDADGVGFLLLSSPD